MYKNFMKMACYKDYESPLLGFEDEVITEELESEVGYWTSKVGGFPDWPVEGISSPNCQLCGLIQPLVVQFYASFQNSPYHRTLYVFSCINPNCWNHSESWTCLRSQFFDSKRQVSPTPTDDKKCATDWNPGADDWDDDNGNFENGNTKPTNHFNQSDNDSDDDSSSLSAGIGNLHVDAFNANYEGVENSSGAVGKQMPPVATAEIEKEENEVVCIDTPTAPQKDLLALLDEAAPVPLHLTSAERNQNSSVSFVPFFISVGMEKMESDDSDHIRELLLKYQRNHGEVFHQNTGQPVKGLGAEDYEKSVPAHGDIMFHHFLKKIQKNPGQILRYGREVARPLLLYPLQDQPRQCKYCQGDVVFDLQLLPTLIPKLRFPGEYETRVEFGTVLIFTCKQSCWSSDDKFREEIVIVQAERHITRRGDAGRSVLFQ